MNQHLSVYPEICQKYFQCIELISITTITVTTGIKRRWEAQSLKRFFHSSASTFSGNCIG